MIEAAMSRKLHRSPSQQIYCALRQGPAPVRRAVLVVHHPQLIALASEPLDGKQEILAAQTVHPARAQYQIRAAARRHCLLAFQLAASVDAQRIGGRGLFVGRGSSAVENIVGRIVDEQSTAAFCFGGKYAWRLRIDRKGE